MSHDYTDNAIDSFERAIDNRSAGEYYESLLKVSVAASLIDIAKSLQVIATCAENQDNLSGI